MSEEQKPKNVEDMTIVLDPSLPPSLDGFDLSKPMDRDTAKALLVGVEAMLIHANEEREIVTRAIAILEAKRRECLNVIDATDGDVQILDEENDK